MAFNKGKFGEQVQADGTWAPSYFVDELHGLTFPTREAAAEYRWHEADALAERDAEMAVERALETNDRYAWECEQDELRAAAWLVG